MLNKISYLAIDSNSPTTTTNTGFSNASGLLFFLLVLARSSNSALAFLEPYQKRSCQKHWTNSTFEHWSFLQSEGVQSYTRAIFRVSNFLHFDTAIPPPLRSFSSIILYFLGLQTHQVNQTLNNNDFVIVPPTNHGI